MPIGTSGYEHEGRRRPGGGRERTSAPAAFALLSALLCAVALAGLPLKAASATASAAATSPVPEPLSLQDAGFVGQFYAAQDAASRPSVLVLGGADGGLPTALAETFAALGYPTLAVAYFGLDGLPAELEMIPLEYFAAPKRWLQQRTQQQAYLLAGWSKGAELALLLASRDKAVRGVIAISPSAVTWPGILKDWYKTPRASWSVAGQGLPAVPFDASGEMHGLLDLYQQSLRNTTAVQAATIAVERIHGPLLLLSGTQDDVWPSAAMAEQVCARRHARHAQAPCWARQWSDVGHLLDRRFMLQLDGQPLVAAHPSTAVIRAFLDGFTAAGGATAIHLPPP